MKNQIRLALLCLAASAAPSYAQSGSPQCGANNYDASRNAYMIMNPVAGAVNQQCYITVYPTGSTPAQARSNPASYLIEGSYAIELSGGGGGGGGGALKDGGGGGGGAGAAPSISNRFLAPGEYKLTIGTGGAGGVDAKTRSLNGNPTNMVNASTGQLIAGFPGADRAAATTSSPSTSGKGGVGAAGGSTGGSGGDSGMRSAEAPAQSGSASASPGTASAGQPGSETGRTASTADGRKVQANAGGGGGAGVGRGGDGASAGSAGATAGALGGGGGGGSGGVRSADMGSRGGNGFIRLSLTALAPQAAAPVSATPSAAPVAPVIQKFSMSSDALFSFGKTTLRPEGEAKLNELVTRLKTVDIDTILSTGHTDRIGSADLNQRLSIDRAEVVKAYLVSKGVQSYRNAAVGMGESQPMTSSSDCKGATSPKVVACLQPDRRVDVEVVVSRKI